jgi:surface protein
LTCSNTQADVQPADPTVNEYNLVTDGYVLGDDVDMQYRAKTFVSYNVKYGSAAAVPLSSTPLYLTLQYEGVKYVVATNPDTLIGSSYRTESSGTYAGRIAVDMTINANGLHAEGLQSAVFILAQEGDMTNPDGSDQGIQYMIAFESSDGLTKSYIVGPNASLLPSSTDNLGASEVQQVDVVNVDGLVGGSTTAHTLVIGNLLSSDQSTLYLDATSGFNVTLPITVVAVVSTRLGSAVSFKEMIPSASLSNFSVPFKMLGDAPFALTAPQSNSAGAFTYSSSNPAVATVSGSNVTIIGAGTTTFIATQSATATYASNSISATFTVLILPTLSNFSVPSKMLGDAPFALTAPQSNSDGAFTYSSSNPDVATLSGSNVTIVGGGTTTFIATQAATATYASNSISATFTVTLPPISLNGMTIQYNRNAADVPENAALFIEANPRGTGLEWFAVVKDGMKNDINAYATGTNGPFIPSGQIVPVQFNNIVTTLMTNFSSTFHGINAFNQPISSWDTANVTNMSYMFFRVNAFNQPIGSWNTAKVTSMGQMFEEAREFNQPIGSWNTANVINMSAMFHGHQDPILYNKFNQPIGSWNTANVTNMYRTFRQSRFNQPIDSWNTANVIYMHEMFKTSVEFNQPIGSWNTAKVTMMDGMFNDAKKFNQNISGWNVDKVESFQLFKDYSPLSIENTPLKFR